MLEHIVCLFGDHILIWAGDRWIVDHLASLRPPKPDNPMENPLSLLSKEWYKAVPPPRLQVGF